VEVALDISSSGPENLTGKSIVIAGGFCGIGLAASKLFPSHGAFVTIADLSPPSEPVPNSTFACCDVASSETILAAFKILVQKHRTVDVLIANASVGEVEDFFLDVLDDEGKLKQPKYRVLDINLKGVLDCVKVAIHYMRQQERGGAIVMTTSTAGYVGEKGLPTYLAAKHGVTIFLMNMILP
jgi:NAD(P)-dependent dehydrogenase (short-subunit alcohol dehydrogenase family)